MKFLSTSFLLASIAVNNAVGRGLQHVGKLQSDYVDAHQRAADRAARLSSTKQSFSAVIGATAHLNDKTKPFHVNGTGVPDIDFDIGESYAGLLPISSNPAEERKLYFWYFPSKNPKASNEITVWMNGGPGCSSLEGLSQENGPWLWQYGTYKPVPNPWTWQNLTNMVWVEQPIGTGFSQGTPNITTEAELAEEFKGFFRNFVDTFDLQNRSVYLTGESYAGQYVPNIASSMLDEENKEYFNVTGVMIYDPSINTDAVLEQVPTAAFVEYWGGLFPFNDTVKAQIKAMDEKCGYTTYLNEHLTYPPKGKFPNPHPTTDDCDIFDYVFNTIFDVNPCFDIYQVATTCPVLWDINGGPGSGNYLPPGASLYFNRTDVKKAINAPLNTTWLECSSGNVFNTKSGLDSGAQKGHYSSTTVLPGVIDRVERTVIGHGMLDMVLLMNGTLLSIQNMTWGGKQGFQEPITGDFYVPFHDDYQEATLAASGIMGKTRTERKLTFVSIFLSGHMVPQYQPSAAFRHLEFLLGRVDSLESKAPFSFFDNGLIAENGIFSDKRSVDDKADEFQKRQLQYMGLGQPEISQIIADYH
ncbi:probable serine-type carboxypeptidase f precursor [Melanopsichium pennsylvanicum]|uniref:Carboxypeptidase n=2 Tax=Melanopsichium pennsylvanicum TaxID=63383 RepID=A0AAJ4XJM8_9BASI|nr:probable serine-type carboxypeptidase f precursor [Melanopsichium pennsylvanicum 4]SNX82961.1 probable serine-type carboxypeptidase f precursor [Melanopsichium pennsylvanicum]